MRCWIGVIASGEVPVVRRNDGVLFALLHVATIPLADAWAAGIGQHCAAKFPERFGDSVALDGGADLLRSGRHIERDGRLDAVLHGVLGDRGAAAHVLVR